MPNTKIPPAVTVGGIPEPNGDQKMTPAEFRMTREALGVTIDWLAAVLQVDERAVRRWESGARPIPDYRREQMEALEEGFRGQAEAIVLALRDAPDVVLSIPAGDVDGYPSGWWRALAYRVALHVDGLHVRYAD